MTPRQRAAGTVRQHTRELAGAVDPLALYQRLCDGGRARGTFLFESGDFAAGVGEQSLLGVSAALHLRADGRTVTIEARSANGVAMLPWLVERLGSAAALDGERIVVKYAAPSLEVRDEAARARLPSPFDALRVLGFGPALNAEDAEVAGEDAEDGDRRVSRYLAAGVFSYDLIELFESLPVGRPEGAPTPHLEFVVPDRLVVIDHVNERTLAIAHAFGGAKAAVNDREAEAALDEIGRAVKEIRARDSSARPMTPSAPPASSAFKAVPDLDDKAFAALVTKLQTHIARGDVFQIVGSRTFTLPCPDPLAAYARLRATEPSPYLFYVRGDETTLFGASPETAVKVHGAPRTVTVRPIAGTAPRGRDAQGEIDADLDARREAALRLDTKEVAEHMMLVDLARNDVARVSRPGTRRVSKLLTVERFTQVMHLVSEVEGILADGLDALHAYAAAMNMGTLVGAPKVRAAQLLREHEATRRGVYGGAVGYLTNDGELDTAIVIRAALVRDGVAAVRAGAGIVHDSTPTGEALETRRKAEAILRAIAGGPRAE